MFKQIKRYINKCYTCQTVRTTTRATQGLLMPLPVPKERWEQISMDFFTGIPKNKKGHNAIFVVIDRLTKRGHFIATRKELTGEGAAKLFVDQIFRLHGTPRSIISDKDIRFLGAFWRTLHELLGTELDFSTVNHPDTDGQTERLNKILNQLLRAYVKRENDDWEDYLPILEFAYNSSHQKSINCSPFMAELRYEPTDPRNLEPLTLSRKSKSAEEKVTKMKAILQRIRDNMTEAQKEQEEQTNRKRRPSKYEKGDWILIDRKNKGIVAIEQKLKLVYLGPYEITNVMNENTYEIDFRTIKNRWRNVNIKWLKPYNNPEVYTKVPPRTPKEVRTRIEEMKQLINHNEFSRIYTVTWKDCDPHSASEIHSREFELAPEKLKNQMKTRYCDEFLRKKAEQNREHRTRTS